MSNQKEPTRIDCPDSETEAYCELPGSPKPENVMVRPAQKIEEPEQFQAWETLNEWF